MVFFNLEDRYGEIECLAFPSQYAKLSHFIRIEAPLYIQGVISSRDGDDDEHKIIVNNILELVENSKFEAISENTAPPVKRDVKAQPEQNEKKPISKIFLRVPDMSCEVYKKAKNIVDIFEGNIGVIFYDSSTSSYNTYSGRLDATPYTLNELRSILGVDNVVAK
jgi:DNA polymerase III alpha subunit